MHGQRHGGERAEHRLGARRRDAERLAERPARMRPARGCAGGPPPSLPAGARPRASRASPAQSSAGGVAGPGPVELEAEARAIGPRRVGAVADDQRADAGLPVAADVEEARLPSERRATCGSCRCSTPRRAREVDRHHARRVRPSTSTSTPRAWRAGTSARPGSTTPVALVTWSSSASRVRGVTAREHRVRDVLRTARSGRARGRSPRARRTRPATASSALMQAL